VRECMRLEEACVCASVYILFVLLFVRVSVSPLLQCVIMPLLQCVIIPLLQCVIIPGKYTYFFLSLP